MAVLVKINRADNAPFTNIDIIKALRIIYNMELWEAKCAYEEGLVFHDATYKEHLDKLHDMLWTHVPNWTRKGFTYTLQFNYEMPPRQAMPQRVGW